MPKYELAIGNRNPEHFDAGDVESYLAAHGAKNVSVLADGTIELDADSDPGSTWNGFVASEKEPPLTLEEVAQAVVGTQADKAKLGTRLAAIKNRRGVGG